MSKPSNWSTADDGELLSAYLDGELTDEEADALERRLGDEPALADRLDRMHGLLLSLRQVDDAVAPSGFEHRLRERLVRERAQDGAAPATAGEDDPGAVVRGLPGAPAGPSPAGGARADNVARLPRRGLPWEVIGSVAAALALLALVGAGVLGGLGGAGGLGGGADQPADSGVAMDSAAEGGDESMEALSGPEESARLDAAAEGDPGGAGQADRPAAAGEMEAGAAEAGVTEAQGNAGQGAATEQAQAGAGEPGGPRVDSTGQAPLPGQPDPLGDLAPGPLVTERTGRVTGEQIAARLDLAEDLLGTAIAVAAPLAAEFAAAIERSDPFTTSTRPAACLDEVVSRFGAPVVVVAVESVPLDGSEALLYVVAETSPGSDALDRTGAALVDPATCQERQGP